MSTWTNVVTDNKINERKWELKHNGILLATIFHKPTDQYSLWVSVPMIFDESKRKINLIAQTYLYNSLVEAKAGFERHIKLSINPWCSAVCSYYGQKSE